MGENGEVSTYPGMRDGERVELEMVRDENDPPPCHVCPKIPDGLPKHWEHAVEFEPWFFAVRQWRRECRAVNDFGNPDPLMRAIAAELMVEDEARTWRETNDWAANLFKGFKR